MYFTLDIKCDNIYPKGDIMNKERKKIVVNDKNFNYYVYSPEEYIENLPVILFLHGIGERGDNLNDIEAYALPKYMNLMNIPFIVIAPQCFDTNFWDYHLRDVEKILNLEQKNYNYDMSNIFLCGYSMGAFGVWNYLMQRPDLFKGIVSVSGGVMLPISDTLNLVKDKPILMYHGEDDDVVDVNESVSAYGKLRKLNANDIELRIVYNSNHFITDQVFSDSYLYEWLKSKVKKRTK